MLAVYQLGKEGMQVLWKSLLASILVISCISSCRFTDDSQSLVIDGNYPIAYIKRPQNSLGSAIDAKLSVVGSDLYLRELASPDASEFNITRALTRGRGIVADPDVSFDGNQIVFSLKCTSDSDPQCSSDTTWNLWVYDRRDGSLNPAITDYQVANVADDLDPSFLPDGRIVFTSSRQHKTFEKTGYQYADEEQRVPASVLHTLDISSQTIRIEQISFNRSHDRNPSVLQNGKIVFSRWEHLGERSQIVIYTANPDGTEMNVLYGAHSPGEAFLHPKELPDGSLLSTVMPLSGTWEGGALLQLDVENYSDANSPAPYVLDKTVEGQTSASIQQIPIDHSISKQGRFTTPFPLFDGSNQVLVGFSFFRAATGDQNVLDDDAEEQESVPTYGIYLLDLNDKSLKPIVLPENGMVVTDPVALYSRKVPPIINRDPPDNPNVFDDIEQQGIIHVKSVYDTDKFGRMGQGVLTVDENAVNPIPLIQPVDPALDSREFVADLVTLKDPLLTTADRRPARFIRVTRSVPIPPGFSQKALGETDYDLTEIVGYASVEPDGSFKVKVPADEPLAISVLDKNGRAYENHTSWLQVRPGETLICNGCHSPQRTQALNQTPIAGVNPNTSLKNSFGQTLQLTPVAGETMAETRFRVDEVSLELNADINFIDVWTNAAVRSPDPSFSYSYASLQTAAPVAGVINYPEHIQPIWDLPRNINGGTRSCVSCHDGITNATNNPNGLNLNKTVGGDGRNISYDSLMVGREIIGEDDLPVFDLVDSIMTLRKGLPLVKAGYARGSHLIEVLFNQELFAERGLAVNGLDHTNFLSDSEKRLVVEWIDIGGQFLNDPLDENGELITLINKLDIGTYNQLHDRFITECALCHSPVTISRVERNPNYAPTSFILMRNAESDFSKVVSMVTDLDVPTNSYILTVPSDATGIHNKNLNQPQLPAEAYLPVGSDFYNDIVSWIQGATP